MPDPIKIPIAQVNKKGEFICPVCDKPVSVIATAKALGMDDAQASAGIGNCQLDGKGHVFGIDEDGAMRANEILAKTKEGAWRKPINRQFGGLPAGAEPPKDEEGKNFLIG